MRIRILVFLLLAIPLLFADKLVLAGKLPANDPVAIQIEVKKLDNEAEILAEYLALFNSPLQYHAQDFVDAARVYELDWRLLPAIAGVESTFGKHIPGGYNGWGWGVYGSQAIYFSSWRDGIFTIAKGLRENYLNKGFNDPYSMNRIYASSPFWGGKVNYFMQDMDRFANKFKANKKAIALFGKNPTIAAVSGRPALR